MSVESRDGAHVRRFKSYPAYKESGVEWLGKVPEKWEVKRVRTVLRDSDGIKIGPFGSALKSDVIQASGYKVYGQEHVINGSFQIGEKYVDQNKFDELSACEIEPGDLVVSMMGTAGRCQVVPDNIERGIMDSHLLRVRPKATVHPPLLARLINESEYIRFQVSTNSKGSIMEGLNSAIIKNLSLLLPSLNEQHAIAAFLDRETERIDQLIARKDRQIALLQEKRSALISHAMTKGLNPKARMKDSGIEWLGEIPGHWEVMRFKYVMVLQRGHDLPSEQFIEGDYPVCASNGIIGYHNDYTTCGPSVTVGRSGSVGEVNYIETNFWAHNTALYVKKFLRSQPRFAYYLLKALDVKYLSEGTAVGTLNRNYIHDIAIPLPSLSDQDAIAIFLDHETNRIDTIAEKIGESTEKLREYRTALISAAVTGKIDVREEVA